MHAEQLMSREILEQEMCRELMKKFAGTRGRVQTAVKNSPEHVLLSKVREQVARFNQVNSLTSKR